MSWFCNFHLMTKILHMQCVLLLVIVLQRKACHMNWQVRAGEGWFPQECVRLICANSNDQFAKILT